ncbi:ribonuclease T2 family protein [Novosphingobium album (ex Liu et al. 2023)]|uniref:Ribonuclease T n=1 Tax=Novosphingobium album (ex Liu et al. 2023) TaxID=3031130 RepID=A0ABT5WVD0_9SPHN|nr:ribonuclease T [Novosphingobium album (ex Liu et al. 2023)]MDE8653822.1 ribonuclease T [Novosphingobium album (ex Liu et al. 2023)]
MKRAAAFAALAAAALGSPAPTLAQAYQCRLPHHVEATRPVQPDGPVRHTAISGYVLAASWSPEYCRMSGNRGSMQCSGINGRFGFVLHGLWPEGRKGADPQWCAATPRPSPDLIRRNLCMTPAPRLLEHEWAKHGSCMAKTPETYFKVSGILWRSLRWPDADHLSRQPDLTAGKLRDAFLQLNPGWKREAIGIVASRSAWLREIKLCYDRHFLPARCDRADFGPSDKTALKIWRGL